MMMRRKVVSSCIICNYATAGTPAICGWFYERNGCERENGDVKCE
jgi:hypothetical protein